MHVKLDLLLLRQQFRFSIDLILVRELPFYTFSRSTPYIQILVLGLSWRKFTKYRAREKGIIRLRFDTADLNKRITLNLSSQQLGAQKIVFFSRASDQKVNINLVKRFN